MTYLLEHENEFKRLELQSKQNFYDVSSEISHIKISPNTSILDAGCGSGLLSRYLIKKHPSCKIHACDYSELRLQQAKNESKNHGINYFHSDLSLINLEDSSVDYIFSRYVYEYLKDPFSITQELYRVLKPGGTICLIDGDGIFINLCTNQPDLNNYLHIIKDKIDIDLFVGRKLNSFLHSVKLENINRKVEICDFTGEDREAEFLNIKEKLQITYPKIIEMLGSKEDADNFCKLYINEFRKKENIFFHNKFICWGTKKGENNEK